MVTLGDKLRQLREENRMAQRQVGAVIEVDGAFISKVESNEKPIKRDHLKKLAKLFKVNEMELQTLWLADKVRNILKEEPQAKQVIEIIETDFK
jgi:transcriptional regulator with XRE-family HTH domain